MLIKVFCSYSHRDRDLKNLLEEHLSPLMRADRIRVFWSDDELAVGTEFLPEIMEEFGTDCKFVIAPKHPYTVRPHQRRQVFFKQVLQVPITMAIRAEDLN